MAFAQALEKADLWVISAEARLVQVKHNTERGLIPFDVLDSPGSMTQLGKQILAELDSCFQHYRMKVEEIPLKFFQLAGPIVQDLPVGFQLVDLRRNNNSVLMQSMLEEPDILKD